MKLANTMSDINRYYQGAGRVTAASTGFKTEFFVALQYQDDEAKVPVDEEEEVFSFHMLGKKLRVVS